jgi:hypothetical protein
MTRILALLILGILPVSGFSEADLNSVTVCELFKNLRSFHNRTVRVRGVLFYGLRQECPQKCGDNSYPTAITLEGAPDTRGVFDEWAKVIFGVESDAKKTGKRFEIWATVEGRLETDVHGSSAAPCYPRNRRGGYGHLNSFPALMIVTRIRDIRVEENAHSRYDYANMYHGPA